MNYLYNGVELPALPKVEGFPYAVILKEPRVLYLITKALYAITNSIGVLVKFDWGSETLRYELTSDGAMWDAESATSESYESNSSFTYASGVLWSNHNISGSGIDYSVPIPISTFDKASFLAGLACGLCERGIGIMPTWETLFEGEISSATTEAPFYGICEGFFLSDSPHSYYRLSVDGQAVAEGVPVYAKLPNGTWNVWYIGNLAITNDVTAEGADFCLYEIDDSQSSIFTVNGTHFGMRAVETHTITIERAVWNG